MRKLPLKPKPTSSSPFSEFIRNASVAEKERVYGLVMQRVIERQNRVAAKANFVG